MFWRLAQGNYRSRSQLKAQFAKLMKKFKGMLLVVRQNESLELFLSYKGHAHYLARSTSFLADSTCLTLSVSHVLIKATILFMISETSLQTPKLQAVFCEISSHGYQSLLADISFPHLLIAIRTSKWHPLVLLRSVEFTFLSRRLGVLLPMRTTSLILHRLYLLSVLYLHGGSVCIFVVQHR